MVLDIDDGVVASYNIVKSAGSWSSQAGTSQLVRTFGGGTARVSDAPRIWLQAESGALGTLPAMSLGVGAAAGMLPFSVLSIRSGVAAIRLAWKRHRALKHVRAAVHQQLQSLGPAASTTGPSALTADRSAVHIETLSLKALDAALEHNRHDGAIGFGYLTTGAVTLARSAEDTAVLSVGLSAAHSPGFAAAAAPALSVMASAAGIVGTFVLGPLAAAFSVILGGVVFHQARRTQKELHADSKLLRQAAQISNEVVARPHPAYQALIERKLDARERFMTRLKRWSAGYLAGTTLSALAAVGKVVLGAAALVGLAAALTNPVGLAVITVLAVVGGVAMTLGSWQFIRLRGKNLRQQSYRLRESRLLSRKLDALHTACCLRSLGGTDMPLITEEPALRAALYDFVRARDRTRQHLLHAIARESGKSRRWELRSGDRADELPGPTRPPQRLNDVAAALDCARTWLKRVVAGDRLGAAREAALRRYAQRSDHLTVTGLASWLDRMASADSVDAEQLLRHHLLDMLKAQADYLAAKLARTERLHQAALGEMSEPARKVFDQVALERRAEEACLQRIRALLSPASCPLETLKHEFLLAQGIDTPALPAASGTSINHRLARYLLTGLREELSAARGILFDMHRNSLELQRQMRMHGGS